MTKEIFGDWRAGQIAFNFVYLVDPELADNVRGDKEIDPFYNDENLDVFWDYLVKETGRDPA